MPRFYKPMMPPQIPAPGFWIYFSGFAEILLGFGITLAHLRNLCAFLIVLMLIVFLWVHIHMWQKRKTKFARISPWILGIRFPVQILFMIWALSFVNWAVLKMPEPRPVVYKTNSDGKKLTGDLYVPQGIGKVPAVVVVHGGSWKHTAGDMKSLSEQIAAAGMVAFNIDYSVAPIAKFPTAVDDVRDAILWLKSHADEYMIDRNQISGWGYSAGAHLILMAGLEPQLGLKAIVAGGTPADLTAWPDSPIITLFLGKSYDKDPQTWQQASPVYNVKADSPPVFLYHGEWDDFVEYYQTERMTQALAAKNVLYEVYRAPYLGHIGTYFWGNEAVQKGLGFLERFHRPD